MSCFHKISRVGLFDEMDFPQKIFFHSIMFEDLERYWKLLGNAETFWFFFHHFSNPTHICKKELYKNLIYPTVFYQDKFQLGPWPCCKILYFGLIKENYCIPIKFLRWFFLLNAKISDSYCVYQRMSLL